MGIRETAVTGQDLNFSIGHTRFTSSDDICIVASTNKSHHQPRYLITTNFFSNATELTEKFQNRQREKRVRVVSMRVTTIFAILSSIISRDSRDVRKS